jgi:hypothetical protein
MLYEAMEPMLVTVKYAISHHNSPVVLHAFAHLYVDNDADNKEELAKKEALEIIRTVFPLPECSAETRWHLDEIEVTWDDDD